MNSIYIGANQEIAFENDSIISVDIHTEVDAIQNELAADTLEATVIYDDSEKTLRNTSWATPITVYTDYTLVGKFYFTSIKRTGPKMYVISATSAVGLMEYETHYGGIFENADFSDVVENIILTNGLSEYLRASAALHRGKYGEQADPSAFCGIKFANTTAHVNYTKFVSRFTLNECLLNDFPTVYANKTSVRIPLVGACLDIGVSMTNTTRYNCGLYMDISRNSTSDSWPEFGEVFFVFGNNVVHSLGTPTGPTNYDVSIDTLTDKAVINGTTYDLSSSSVDGGGQWNYYGGGRLFDGVSFSSPPTLCDIEYYCQVYYTRSSSSLTYTNTFNACVYQNDNGELYVGNGMTKTVNTTDLLDFAELLPEYTIDLRSNSEFPKSIANEIEYAPGIDTLKVNGWLPVLTKREALHQLLFASNVILKKTESGGIIFSPMSKTEDEIQTSDMYEGGSEEYQEHTNSIELTEHSFIYDSGKAKDTACEITEAPSKRAYIVQFGSAPFYESFFNNGFDALIAYNCNVAAVAGTGKLTAIPYTHQESIVRRNIGTYGDGKTVTITDATLVTALNSESCANKLASYYGEAYTIQNDVVFRGNRCGDFYKFMTSFYDRVSGFLVSMATSLSEKIRSTCSFICNYDPPHVGSDYTNYVILTGTGTWNVPEEVFESDSPKIRIVLIGGGQGGNSGCAGEANTSTTTAAKGGEAGDPGTAGKVFDLVIHNPNASYQYATGIGGAGGDISTDHETHNSGENGTNTTLTDGVTTYNSGNGSVYQSGYKNPLTGDIYAKPYKSYKWKEADAALLFPYITGQGGDGGYITTGSGSYTKNLGGYTNCWENTEIYPNTGHPGSFAAHSDNASGGLGGGGASGGTAEKGKNNGYGGKGADAVYTYPKATDFNPLFYGYGGQGGCGGGGGGAGGYNTTGKGGSGGYGGKGGTGGDGCVVIFY